MNRCERCGVELLPRDGAACVACTEPPLVWACRVWAAWTPHERAQVAGALDVIVGGLRGAGDGSPAPHRRRAA